MVRILLTNPVKGYLDIKTGTSFPINLSLGDIRDISKRNGSYSKTITLVGNKNNNKLLSHLYDINTVDGSFNINKLQECLIEQDGVVILDNMYLQLINIRKVQRSGVYDFDVEYECEVRDSSSDFFMKINNLELSNLDFSEFNNHTYTTDNIISSFSNTWVDGYKYIVPNIQTAISLDGSDRRYSLKDFRPGLYVRQYWDKIFSNSGYTYTFDGMDDNDIQFNKLIIPYNGDEVFIDEDNSLDVIATNSTDIIKTVSITKSDNISALPTGLNAASNIIPDTEIKDIQNQYNPTTGIYSPIFNITGDATLEFKFEIDYDIEIVTPTKVTLKTKRYSSYRPDIKIRPTFILRNNMNGLEINQKFEEYVILYGTSFNAGTTTISQKSINFVMEPGYIDTFSRFISKLDLSCISSLSNSITRRTDVAWYDDNNNIIKPQYRIRIKNITMKVEPNELPLDYKMPVSMNLFIPKKIKQSDFVKSLCQMYNLYITVDSDDKSNLIIKSRDKYYDGGVVKDWSDKLAKDRQQDLKFLPELSNKKLVLTYKQDKDVANTGYFINTNEVYGQIEFTFENEYVKGVDKNELLFSPTPTIKTNFGAYVPYIDGYKPKNNIRILLDNGVYDCGEYYIKDEEEVVVTNYPFISHFSDPNNPTFDINYGTCDYYFYNDYKITDNNLFNLHWRRTLRQINEGKLLKAYFNLSPLDIQKIDLSDKIRIDNSYWNINKIIDYDANSDNLTVVELISVDDEFDLPPFVIKNKIIKHNKSFSVLKTASLMSASGTQQRINENTNLNNSPYVYVNGAGNIIDSNAVGSVNGDNNYITSGNIIVNGDNNNLKSSAFVYGDNNTIDYTSDGNVVYGDNNKIEPGVENSLIVGSNLTLGESGSVLTTRLATGDVILDTIGLTYLGGIYIEDGYVETGYINDTSGGIFFSQDATTGSIKVNLDVDEVTIKGSPIGGDLWESSTGQYSIISKNGGNTASGVGSFVAGSINSSVTNTNSVIVGGDSSRVLSYNSGIVAGFDNTVSGYNSSILGGYNNTVSGYNSSILGGQDNTVSGNRSCIIGGYDAIVSGTNSVKIGNNPVLSSPNTTDSNTTYIGGLLNLYTLRNYSSLSVSADGTLTLGSGSDERLKKNIKDLTSSLEKVKQLRGVSFEWINENSGIGTKYGFIAQEVQKVIPELITTVEYIEQDDLKKNKKTNKAEVLTMEYKDVVPFLVEAIKEMNTPEYRNIPKRTPKSSLDESGEVGEMSYDKDFLYIKRKGGWGRIKFEDF